MKCYFCSICSSLLVMQSCIYLLQCNSATAVIVSKYLARTQSTTGVATAVLGQFPKCFYCSLHVGHHIILSVGFKETPSNEAAHCIFLPCLLNWYQCFSKNWLSSAGTGVESINNRDRPSLSFSFGFTICTAHFPGTCNLSTQRAARQSRLRFSTLLCSCV